MNFTRKQEEDIKKLVDEGVVQDKEQFIKDAVAKHLNKSEIKRELRKLDKDKVKRSEKDRVRRIGIKFNDELEDIKKKIKKKTGKNISNGKITNMIPRHDKWPGIKEDLVEHQYNYYER